MHENLHIYLNDHLAGSVGAVQLLERLIEDTDDPAGKTLFRGLLRDIEEDRGELKRLLHHLGVGESIVRKAGAWVLEKLSHVKLRVSGEDQGLGLFQSLEGLALGIAGKHSLWQTLGALAPRFPELRILDYPQLAKRAEEQIRRVEAKSLELAPVVLLKADS